MSEFIDWFFDKTMGAGLWGEVAAISLILLASGALIVGAIVVASTPWLWLPTAGVAVFIVLMSFWKTFGPGR